MVGQNDCGCAGTPQPGGYATSHRLQPLGQDWVHSEGSCHSLWPVVVPSDLKRSGYMRTNVSNRIVCMLTHTTRVGYGSPSTVSHCTKLR